VQRSIDAEYLRDQYGTTEKLDIRVEAHQRYSQRTDDFLDWIVERLKPRPGDLVLDVGCGRGPLHARLARRGARAILGVDRSPAMVAATQQQANANRLPVVAIEANAERLPLADSSYDAAIVTHVLFLVDDVDTALRELRRVLKPDGRAVLSTTPESTALVWKHCTEHPPNDSAINLPSG
jgi:ubiquinone/menaquinone biosynthesis C-methylase UbiE